MHKETYTDQIFKLDAPFDNKYQGNYPRVLFVCSAGILRSATAATLAAQRGWNARSCGSKEYALIPLSLNLIMWADSMYFVNEENYHDALYTFGDNDAAYSRLTDRPRTHIWDIEDNYEYMDPQLINIINKLLT